MTSTGIDMGCIKAGNTHKIPQVWSWLDAYSMPSKIMRNLSPAKFGNINGPWQIPKKKKPARLTRLLVYLNLFEVVPLIWGSICRQWIPVLPTQPQSLEHINQWLCLKIRNSKISWLVTYCHCNWCSLNVTIMWTSPISRHTDTSLDLPKQKKYRNHPFLMFPTSQWRAPYCCFWISYYIAWHYHC